MLKPTTPTIIPICLFLSDFSAAELVGKLVGEVFITVVIIGGTVLVIFGGCSGSNCVIHVKFLMSRI